MSESQIELFSVVVTFVLVVGMPLYLLRNNIRAVLKRMSYEEFLDYEIDRLKKQLEEIEDYEPNMLTFIRDAWGFGRIDLSLITYGAYAVFSGVCVFLFGLSVYGLLVFPVMALASGVILTFKYPVSNSYRFRFGKKAQ